MIDLFLKNKPSNNDYKNEVGEEKFKEELDQLLEEKGFQCQCCRWKTLKNTDINNIDPNYLKWIKKYFTIQPDQNEETEELEKYLICISCYLINHIRQAVENNYVRLVNSIYDQQQLIRISWADAQKGKIVGTNRENAISSGLIVPLLWDYEYYLDIIENKKKKYKKIKVIFTDKFLQKFKYNQ